MSPEDYESYSRMRRGDAHNAGNDRNTRNVGTDYVRGDIELAKFGDLPVILPENLFRFECELIRETEKAYLLRGLDDTADIWIPKKQATLGWADHPTNTEEQIFCADLTAWIVEDKKLLK